MSRREKYLLIVFCAMAFAGLSILLGASYLHFTTIKASTGGSATIGIIGSPRFINPALSQINETDRDLSGVIFSSLLKYDGNGNLIKDAADDYIISDDGKTYEVTVRKDVKWQDDRPLTADDVIFTLETIQNSDFRSPLRTLWLGVEIEKIDDWTLLFHLKNSYAPFLGNLTFGILPKHIWSDIPASQFALNELNLKPVGSGPYQFSKLQKDKNGSVKTMELEAFKNYFAGEAYISKLTFKFYSTETEILTAYKKGEIDTFSLLSAKNLTELMRKGEELNAYSITLPRYFAVFFNQSQNKFLADKNVRQALTHATDKKKIIETVFEGYAKIANSPLLPGMTGYTDQFKIFDFDVEKAKSILAAAGWKDTDGDGVVEIGKENEKLELSLTTLDWPELKETANLLAEQWSAIGARVNVEIKDTASIQNEIIKTRQYQSLLFGEVLGLEPGLFHFWHSSQKKESGLNLSQYENGEVDKFITQITEDLNTDSRAEKIRQAINRIIDDSPAIFLFSPDYIFVTDKGIKGIDLNLLDVPSSRFSQINSWYLTTRRTLR